MTDPFLIRLLIGVLLYFILNIIITTFVNEAQAQRLFQIILLIVVVLYIFFGAFLPFK